MMLSAKELVDFVRFGLDNKLFTGASIPVAKYIWERHIVHGYHTDIHAINLESESEAVLTTIDLGSIFVASNRAAYGIFEYAQRLKFGQDKGKSEKSTEEGTKAKAGDSHRRNAGDPEG